MSVWNGLLTNWEYYRKCVLLGTNLVQEGPVGETFALQARSVGETVAKHDILM
jgi:hypothetical protein